MTKRRIFLGFSGLLLFAIAFVAISISLALDWDRTHSSATSELPFYEAGMADGLYRLQANDMVFRARVYGAKNEGPGIIMLHGHPETSIMWEPLAAEAARRGYRVIAFDQRGYSPGAKPDGVAAYRADSQVADVIAVADKAGFDRFHLVGHDWGAVIGWTTTIFHPDRVASLVAMSIPHPQTLKAMVVDDTPAYVRLFTLPWVPEATLLFNDMSGYRDTWSQQSEAELAEYSRVFAEPGASTATLNWYRSIEDSLLLLEDRDPAICAPTLFIYGDEEFWVTPDYLAQQRKLVAASYAEIELKAGHWLIQAHPDEVISAVIGHVARSGIAPDESEISGC